jgi:outer membrane lipoprotein SlyB
MKPVALMLASFVLAFVLSFATYNDTLSGSQTAAPEAEGIALNLTATGDLPGMTKVNLHRTGENVTAGSLRLTVLPQNADASSTERGQLVGTISGGTLTTNSEGTIASASGVHITIQSGTGEFAAITSGTATLNITAGSENPSQLSGTLVLNF